MASYACERHHMWRMQAARTKNVMLQILFYSETSSFNNHLLAPIMSPWNVQQEVWLSLQTLGQFGQDCQNSRWVWHIGIPD